MLAHNVTQFSYFHRQHEISSNGKIGMLASKAAQLVKALNFNFTLVSIKGAKCPQMSSSRDTGHVEQMATYIQYARKLHRTPNSSPL